MFYVKKTKTTSCALTLYGMTFDVILHIVKWYWHFKGENHEFFWIDRYLAHHQVQYKWKALLLGIFSSVLFLLFTLLVNFKFCFLVCIKNWEEGENLRRTQLLKKCRDFYPRSRWSTLTISLLKPCFLKSWFLLKVDVFYWLYYLTIY